jgi:hypothetical protein
VAQRDDAHLVALAMASSGFFSRRNCIARSMFSTAYAE